MKLFLIILLILVMTGCVTDSKKQVEETKEITEGIFITEILDSDKNRVNNLKICAEKLDGITIKSGEVFSFNETVGQRTAEKGYKKAKIIVGNDTEYAIGGGVCQISSTLMGAAKDAGLKITERHSHNKKVNYVKEGEDAAVSYGTQDFRFKNTTDRDMIIKIEVKNGQVKAEIVNKR